MTAPGTQQYAFSFHQDLSCVDPAQWNALAEPLSTPFLEWEWLRLLETTGCVGPQTGWAPHHLLVRAGDRLVAAAPLYLKAHSEGEFVFDRIWYELSQWLDLEYYPKLVGMCPFTPVEGYRFLIHPLENEQLMTRLMVSAIDRLCLAGEVSGCAFHFVDGDWSRTMERHGFHAWEHQSYVWRNPGYARFDDYLASLSPGRRRSVRRERRDLARAGVRVEAVRGEDITPAHLDWMFELYKGTNDKFGIWGCRYLNRELFQSLHRAWRDRLLFTVAHAEDQKDRPLAMALLAYKGDTLFGRYWGCFQEVRYLHFELCYYTPIQWCIEQGLARFDPGMGGLHKTLRGFEAGPVHSLHRFYDQRLQRILAEHIGDINALEREEITLLNRRLPLKRG